MLYLVFYPCLNAGIFWMPYLMSWSLIITHVSSWGKLPNPIGYEGLHFSAWVYIFLLKTISLFTYQLCLISIVIYQMFCTLMIPYSLGQFNFKFDIPPFFQFKRCTWVCQVFWLTVTFFVIVHIILCIYYSMVGYWNRTVFYNLKKITHPHQ